MKKNLAGNGGYLISLVLFCIAMIVLHYELKHYHIRDITAELKQVKLVSLKESPSPRRNEPENRS